MNKGIIGFAIGTATCMLFGFTIITTYEANNSTAEVEQMQGLYIFSDSKPVKEYEYLGSVKSNTGGFGSPQYTGVRDRLIKNAKKKYPNGEGLILNLKTGSADLADVIKFKE